MIKVGVTCNKNIIQRFDVEKPEGWEFDFIDYPCSDQELIKRLKDVDIILSAPVDYISKDVIDSLKNCKLIHSLGVGFDKIDLEAAREKGIYVCNNRAVNAMPVAELAVGHMISCLRRIPEADNMIKTEGLKGFKKSFGDYQVKGQVELNSRIIGLVGLGAIGKLCVQILKAFGCEIKYYDVFRDESFEKEMGISYASYEEILKTCDIISYHVPVLESTINMVRKETIDMMKPNAIVINIARGEIVNNEDLADALNNGRIYAGLDVIFPEPPPENHPIFNLNEIGKSRLSITPHIAGTTDDVYMRAAKWAYENGERVLRGERPINIVNKIKSSL